MPAAKNQWDPEEWERDPEAVLRRHASPLPEGGPAEPVEVCIVAGCGRPSEGYDHGEPVCSEHWSPDEPPTSEPVDESEGDHG